MSAVSVGVEWHVSASAEAEGDPRDGSAAHPFGTVSAAAAVAQPGDTITIHAGVYRERVVPPRGGTSDSRRITYQAAPGDRPTITGSERYTSWHPIGHNVWRLHLPNATFGTCNPYAEPVRGDWFEDGGMQHLRGMVLQDGAQLPQAANLTTLFEHARPAWWAQVGSATTEILGWFAVDPNVSAVEVAVRETVFSPAQPHINYLTVRGLDLRNAATNWVSPTEGQEGLLTALWCRGWVIEDNDIAGSRCCGIALAKASDEWDGLRGTTEGYYLTIEDARRYGGWSRDTIGGHIVRNNRIRECGQTGIVGSLGCAFSVIEGNEVSSCNTQNIWGGAEMAGIKLHGAIDTIIRDNHIHHNGTFGGLWLDWMAQGTLITGNVLHDNAGQDIFLEVNHGPVLVATNVLLSPVSYLANTRGRRSRTTSSPGP